MLLVGVGIIVYFKTLLNGFVWDNIPQIIDYQAVRTFKLFDIFTSSAAFVGSENVMSVYYKPIMYVFFSFIHLLFKENPFGYHIVQVSLHIANSIILFILFRTFFKSELALILSLLFLVHPINYESVGYISALQDTLFVFFGLLALLILVKDSNGKEWSFKTYFLVGFTLLLSLLSKETGYLFVIICFVYLAFFNKARISVFNLTLLVSQVFYILFRLVSVQNIYAYLTPSAIMQSSFLNRLISTPSILFYYIFTFIYPQNLSINNHWETNGISFSTFFFPLIVLIALFMIFVFELWTLFKGKSNFLKSFIFFSFWFFLGLFFHSQIFFTADMTVADRWFYFTFVGLLGMLGVIISQFEKSKVFNLLKSNKIAITIILLILLPAYSLRTIVRSFDWKDKETLYSHDLNVSKDNYSLENMYGAILLQKGDLENAAAHIKRSIQLNSNYGPPYTNLGYYYEKRQEYENSKLYYRKSIEISSNDDDTKPFGALARIELFHDENPIRAKELAEDGIDRYPKDTYLPTILAMSEYALGNKEKAVKIVSEVYERDQSDYVRKIKTGIENNVPIK